MSFSVSASNTSTPPATPESGPLYGAATSVLPAGTVSVLNSGTRNTTSASHWGAGYVVKVVVVLVPLAGKPFLEPGVTWSPCWMLSLALFARQSTEGFPAREPVSLIAHLAWRQRGTHVFTSNDE